MDGAIILNANATKIAMANVQFMPDPTILSLETGTRHRTAERVSKQTDALVIADLPAARGRLALRRRREVHPRGHPRRARQGQPGARDARQVPHAPGPGLDATDRAGVRGRRHPARRPDRAAALRARDAHGRRDRALHRRAGHRGPPDRDAARGGHGRRRRRQGRAASTTTSPRTPTRPSRPPSISSAACPTRTCSTSGAWRSWWATTASSTRSTIRYRPAATGSWAASRACRSSSWRRSSRSSAASTSCWRRPTPSWRGVEGVGRDPSEGHPRGTSPVAGDQPRRSLPADLGPQAISRGIPGRNQGGHHSGQHRRADDRGPRGPIEFVNIDFELGDNVVYPASRCRPGPQEGKANDVR